MTTALSRKMFQAAGVVSLLLIASRLLGYVREAFLAARFGATHVTDAYLVAQEIPFALFSAISTALLMVFIPIYRRVLQAQDQATGQRLVNNTLNVTLLLTVILMALGWLAAPAVVPRLVPGLPPQVLRLAVTLTRIMLPMMFFLALAGVFSAVLNANHHFTGPALVGFVSNVIVIGVLWMVIRPDQITWVAWAVVGGAAAGALVQAPWLARVDFGYQPVVDLRDPALLQMGRLIIPVMITTTATQAQVFVDRFLASRLAEGSISALQYALRVSALPYGVIGAAISTVIYPKLAEHAAAKDRAELGRTIHSGLSMLAFVLWPMALGLLAFREPIVQIVFQRGAFDPRATAATALALAFYAVGILFFGWLDFVNRCFFVLEDTLTPMWIGLLMVALNIGFNIMLVGPLAQGGLALGTSLSTALAVGLLLWRLRGRLTNLDLGSLVRSAIGSAAAAAVGTLAGVAVYRLVHRLLPGGSVTDQAVRLSAGLGTIVIVHTLLGNRVGADLAARLAQKFRSGKS